MCWNSRFPSNVLTRSIQTKLVPEALVIVPWVSERIFVRSKLWKNWIILVKKMFAKRFCLDPKHWCGEVLVGPEVALEPRKWAHVVYTQSGPEKKKYLAVKAPKWPSLSFRKQTPILELVVLNKLGQSNRISSKQVFIKCANTHDCLHINSSSKRVSIRSFLSQTNDHYVSFCPWSL